MSDSDKSGARVSFEFVSGEELAKYAFDQKVEESGMRVLRPRLYPLIAVISALLSALGIGLTWWANKVATRVTSLNDSVVASQTSIAALGADVKRFQVAARDLELRKEQLDAAMSDFTKRGQRVDEQTVSALERAAAAQSSGVAAREMAVQAEQALNKVLSDVALHKTQVDDALDTVQKNAVQSTSDRNVIQGIRGEAAKFAAAVKEHRALVAATVADSISLRSNDTSNITVPNLTGQGSFKIRFQTGDIRRRKPFDVFYTVGGGDKQTVHVSRNDIRRQIPMDGTDGQYQFMIEFIYSAITVPDFVTIRVSGAPQRLSQNEPTG